MPHFDFSLINYLVPYIRLYPWPLFLILGLSSLSLATLKRFLSSFPELHNWHKLKRPHAPSLVYFLGFKFYLFA